MFLEWTRQMCWYYLDSFPLELLLGFLYFSTTTKKHQLLEQTLFFSTKFSTSKLQMKNYFVSTWLNQHLKETGNNTIFLLSPGGKKIAAHNKRVGCNTVTQGQLKMSWMTEKWLLQFNINLQEWSYKSLRKLTWPSFLLVSYTMNFCVLIRE